MITIMYARINELKNPDGKLVIVFKGPFCAGSAKNQLQLREMLREINADDRGGTILVKTYENTTIGQAFKLSEKAFRKMYDEIQSTHQISKRKKHGMV